MVVTSGPVSTSMAVSPSRTKIESPCPTSSTTISLPGRSGGPSTTKSRLSAAKAAAIRTRHRRLGCGHRTHATAMPTAHATLAHTGKASTGKAAPGSDAIAVATRTTSEVATHAPASNPSPAAGHSGASSPPDTPAASAAWTSGTTATSVTAPAVEIIPNIPAAMGSVPSCRLIRLPSPSPTRHSPSGSAADSHLPISGPNTTTLATAITPSCSPTSNTARGSMPTRTTVTAARPAIASRLRPSRCASHPATTSSSARSTATRSPVASANAAPAASAAAACARRCAPATRATQAATRQASPRCSPDAATRCPAPATRSASSAGVPAIRRRSPSSVDASKSPPGPRIRPMRVPSCARH